MGPQGPLNKIGIFAMRIGRRPENKICSSGWVCLVKFNLWGAHPNPSPAGSTPPTGGISLDNLAGTNKQKLLLGVGFPGKFLFVGGSLQPGAPQGPLHQMGVLA
jgi:hypothetical protein